MKARISNVMQGEADVMIGERRIGHVSQRYGTDADAGWNAYDAEGRCVNKYPSIKRSHAVQELEAHESQRV